MPVKVFVGVEDRSWQISILPLFGWRCLGIFGWRCLWLEVGEQSAARRGKRTELWFEVYLWLKEGPSAARRSKEGPEQLEEGRHWALS